MLLPAVFAALGAMLPAQGARDDAAVPQRIELLSVSKWDELLSRDARASFGLRTPTAAREILEDRGASEERRAAALLALGAGKFTQFRGRVLELTAERSLETKRAAIWALALYRDPIDVPVLVDFAERKAAGVAEAGVFALALHGSPAARAECQRLSQQVEGGANTAAAAALAFLRTPPEESEVARSYLELRFQAARWCGLVDGQAWESLLVEDLARNAKFLSRVVYRSAALVERPGIADHFLEVALAGAPPERLRGVVRAIPEQLSQLVESGLFTPASDEEWRILVDEIGKLRLEVRSEPLLRKGWSVPAVRPQVAGLLARAGGSRSLQLLELHLRSGAHRERALAAEALGAAGDASYVADLAAMELDPDPSVRASALVARVRLGDSSALPILRERAGLKSDKPMDVPADAQATWEAVARCADQTAVRVVAVELLERVPTGVRSRIACELLAGGYEPAREIVHGYLASGVLEGEAARRAVEALGLRASAADLVLFRRLFPLGNQLEVDVELACALVRSGDAETVPLLRAALWSEPWNRSVLAAALWISVAGMEPLRLEVQRPPPGASARDLRRVGFALGEWGGLAEVDWLSARIGPAEPALQGAVLGALGARTH